jgi:Domain of unknown function (DUF1707)
MDTPGPLVPLPALHQRAGDNDRSAVCDQLAAHFAAGRLREDELDARLSAAVAAPTLVELRRLVSDLPNLAPAARPAPAPAGWRWSLLDVVALLAVVGCLGFAGLAVLALGASGSPGLVVAGFLGGSVAAVGGAALAHLAHRGWQRSLTRAAAEAAGQRPRIA